MADLAIGSDGSVSPCSTGTGVRREGCPALQLLWTLAAKINLATVMGPVVWDKPGLQS